MVRWLRRLKHDPVRLFACLLAVIFVLLLANGLGILSTFYFGHDQVYGMVPLFDFNAEMNAPTLFSAALLLGCAGLLSVIAWRLFKQGGPSLGWAGLALAFSFLSLDEAIAIHERLETPMKALVDASGVLFFPWVLPYGIGLLLMLLVYSRFLLRLPRPTAVLFVLAGATYVTGAIGFEMIGALLVGQYGRDNLGYALIATVEELLEMLGVSLFFYALHRFLIQPGSRALANN